MAATDLYGCARELLDAVVVAVTGSPGGAISRAYVCPGVPALDCEQITVHVGGPSVAETAPLSPPLQPGHRLVDTGAVPLVALTATVARCCPVADDDGAEPPAAADLEAVAEVTLGDIWAIWNHAITQHRAGALFQNPGGTRELFLDPAVPLAIQGGLAGWQAPFRVALGGYAA